MKHVCDHSQYTGKIQLCTTLCHFFRNIHWKLNIFSTIYSGAIPPAKQNIEITPSVISPLLTLKVVPLGRQNRRGQDLFYCDGCWWASIRITCIMICVLSNRLQPCTKFWGVESVQINAKDWHLPGNGPTSQLKSCKGKAWHLLIHVMYPWKLFNCWYILWAILYIQLQIYGQAVALKKI